jgi:hypothetical protein
MMESVFQICISGLLNTNYGKRQNNKHIIDIMGEAYFAPLFFVAGIEALKEIIATKSDSEVSSLFNGQIPTGVIRKKVNEIHIVLNKKGKLIS